MPKGVVHSFFMGKDLGNPDNFKYGINIKQEYTHDNSPDSRRTLYVCEIEFTIPLGALR